MMTKRRHLRKTTQEAPSHDTAQDKQNDSNKESTDSASDAVIDSILMNTVIMQRKHSKTIHKIKHQININKVTQQRQHTKNTRISMSRKIVKHVIKLTTHNYHQKIACPMLLSQLNHLKKLQTSQYTCNKSICNNTPSFRQYKFY